MVCIGQDSLKLGEHCVIHSIKCVAVEFGFLRDESMFLVYQENFMNLFELLSSQNTTQKKKLMTAATRRRALDGTCC